MRRTPAAPRHAARRPPTRPAGSWWNRPTASSPRQPGGSTGSGLPSRTAAGAEPNGERVARGGAAIAGVRIGRLACGRSTRCRSARQRTERRGQVRNGPRRRLGQQRCERAPHRVTAARPASARTSAHRAVPTTPHRTAPASEAAHRPRAGSTGFLGTSPLRRSTRSSSASMPIGVRHRPLVPGALGDQQLAHQSERADVPARAIAAAGARCRPIGGRVCVGCSRHPTPYPSPGVRIPSGRLLRWRVWSSRPVRAGERRRALAGDTARPASTARTGLDHAGKPPGSAGTVDRSTSPRRRESTPVAGAARARRQRPTFGLASLAGPIRRSVAAADPAAAAARTATTDVARLGSTARASRPLAARWTLPGTPALDERRLPTLRRRAELVPAARTGDRPRPMTLAPVTGYAGRSQLPDQVHQSGHRPAASATGDTPSLRRTVRAIVPGPMLTEFDVPVDRFRVPLG